MILGFGIATQVVVAHGLQTRTDSIQVKVVAGVVESRGLAIHIVPVRTGLTLLIESSVVGTKEPSRKKKILQNSIIDSKSLNLTFYLKYIFFDARRMNVCFLLIITN